MQNAKMRAVIVEKRGSPAVLRVGELPIPVCGPGQVLIKTVCAGVNWADVMQREGSYPNLHPLPYVPGSEVAGVVEAVGQGVTSIRRGERVAALVMQGGYAEYALALEPLTLPLPLPAAVDFAHACALLVQGLTAQLLVSELVRESDRVLVTAAAGGVGSLTVQLAAAAGAKLVVGAARGREKCARVAELGAQAVDYSSQGWVEQARALSQGQGFDCILDSVGGQLRSAAFTVLAPFGRMGIYGDSSQGEGLETWTPARWFELLMKHQSIHGLAVTTWIAAHPGFVRQAYARLLALCAQGALRAQVFPAFELEQAERAHQVLADRQTVGKVVLRVGPDS